MNIGFTFCGLPDSRSEMFRFLAMESAAVWRGEPDSRQTLWLQRMWYICLISATQRWPPSTVAPAFYSACLQSPLEGWGLGDTTYFRHRGGTQEKGGREEERSSSNKRHTNKLAWRLAATWLLKHKERHILIYLHLNQAFKTKMHTML